MSGDASVPAPSRLPWLVVAIGALALVAAGLGVFAVVVFWPHDAPDRSTPTVSHEESPPTTSDLRREDAPTAPDGVHHAVEVRADPVEPTVAIAPTQGAETTAPTSPPEPARAEDAPPGVEPTADPQDGPTEAPRRSPRSPHERRPVRPIAPAPLSGPTSAPGGGRTRGGFRENGFF